MECAAPNSNNTESSGGHMLYRSSIGSLALAAALLLTVVGATAHDESKYPGWSGQ